jgi:hypothetical protein
MKLFIFLMAMCTLNCQSIQSEIKTTESQEIKIDTRKVDEIISAAEVCRTWGNLKINNKTYSNYVKGEAVIQQDDLFSEHIGSAFGTQKFIDKDGESKKYLDLSDEMQAGSCDTTCEKLLG